MNMILPARGESFIFPRTAGHMSSRIAGATGSPAVHFELPRFTLTPNLPKYVYLGKRPADFGTGFRPNEND